MMILAHRGASSYAPENTMAAFYKALEMKANGIELDLKQTKDGEIVVFHDTDVSRTTNQSGNLRNFTLQEIQEFDAGSWFSGEYTGEKVVRFEDFLYYFGSKPIYLAIELKDDHIEAAVLAILQKFELQSKITITSFNFDNLVRMRSLSQSIELGFLTNVITEKIIEQLKEFSIRQICPNGELLEKEHVELARKSELEIRSWNTSSEEIMQHVIDCGVDGMTIDFPDKLVEALDKK